MYTARKRYAGLTLIEVLVALLVLSLGAFSLVIASTQSMRLAVESMRHSLALAAGSDLLSLQQALLRRHPHLMGSAGFSKGQPLIDGPDCALTLCEPAELQAFLQYSWRCSLGYADGCPESEALEALPGFDAELMVHGTSGALRLRIEWRAKDQVRHLELESQVP